MKIPKSGFINVLDFRTIRELGDYLRYLDKNATAYNEYFRWKELISVNKNRAVNTFVPLCDMCIYMNLERFYGIQKKVLVDVSEFHGKRENCRKASIESTSRGDSLYKLSDFSRFSWF